LMISSGDSGMACFVRDGRGVDDDVGAPGFCNMMRVIPFATIYRCVYIYNKYIYCVYSNQNAILVKQYGGAVH
jgi:hypothetical protein